MKAANFWVTSFLPIAVFTSVSELAPSLGPDSSPGSPAFLIAAAIPILLYVMFWRWIRGRISVPRSETTGEVRRLFGKLRRAAAYNGTRAIVLSDEQWKEGIDVAIASADAIVFDVTELSDAVEWELTRVFERVPPERVLLASGTDTTGLLSEAEEEAIRRGTRERLAEILDAEALDRCRHLVYRLRDPGRSSSAMLGGGILDYELASVLVAAGGPNKGRGV